MTSNNLKIVAAAAAILGGGTLGGLLGRPSREPQKPLGPSEADLLAMKRADDKRKRRAAKHAQEPYDAEET